MKAARPCWSPADCCRCHDDALGSREAAASEYENLEYRGGRLHWPRGSAVAAVGRSGVKADKHEGDGATPAGTYPLVSIYLSAATGWRARLHTLPVTPLAPNHGWVDGPGDPNYNRLVSLPYPASPKRCGGRTAFTMRWW